MPPPIGWGDSPTCYGIQIFIHPPKWRPVVVLIVKLAEPKRLVLLLYYSWGIVDKDRWIHRTKVYAYNY